MKPDCVFLCHNKLLNKIDSKVNRYKCDKELNYLDRNPPRDPTDGDPWTQTETPPGWRPPDGENPPHPKQRPSRPALVDRQTPVKTSFTGGKKTL